MIQCVTKYESRFRRLEFCDEYAQKRLISISDRVDRAPATEAVDSGWISNRSKTKPNTLLNLIFTCSLLDV